MLEAGMKAKKKMKLKKININNIEEIDMGNEVGMCITKGNQLRKWKTRLSLDSSSDDETPLKEPYNKYESGSE